MGDTNPEPFAPDVMKLIFTQFSQGMTQMFQASINQQAAIDELRAAIRSCQNQILNITSSMDEFENRLFVKVQDMRPTIYTRDGVPIDDVLEVTNQKIAAINEGRQAQAEAISRLDAEMKTKIGIDQFEDKLMNHEGGDTLNDLSICVQNLQKDLLKQRSDMDSMSERLMQMVKINVEQYTSAKINEGLDSDDFVKQEEFIDTIEKIKKILRNPFGDVNSMIDELLGGPGEMKEKLLSGFDLLSLQRQKLDQVYEDEKAKLNENYDKLLKIADEQGDALASSDVVFDEEFEFEWVSEEREYRDIGFDVDGDCEEGVVYTATHECQDTRRSISIQARPNQKGKSLQEAIKEVKNSQAAGKASSRISASLSDFDEQKLVNMTSTVVLGKVEQLITDMLQILVGKDVKLDPSDIKALVKQLQVLAEIKEDLQKLKVLMPIKYDKADAKRELDFRITRDEFFDMLVSLFPNNPALQKMYVNYKKKLPPLNEPPTKERSTEEVVSRPVTVTHTRSAKTTTVANLVPSRNSKLLALNQKWLQGADGRYYLRDLSDTTTATPSGTTKEEVTVEAAYDFQPFIPAPSLRPRTSTEVVRIEVPQQHRVKTPRDTAD